MSLYHPPGSEIWWIDIRHNGQRVRKTTGTTEKAAAQELYDRVKAELWRVAKLGETPSYTWDDAVKRWLVEHQHKKSLSDDKDRLLWASKYLTGKPIVEITLDTIEDLIKHRQKDPAYTTGKKKKALSDSTINRYMSAISAILHSAVAWGWITTTPKIRKLKEAKKRVRYLTKTETCRLITELPMHLAEMACFTLATGLRENNVIELEWSQVDLNRKIAWAYGDQTKNEKPLPIPLSAEAIAVLTQRKGQHPRFVFTYDGHPVTKCSNHAWNKAKTRAGIVDFRWHDLRHTWASWHIMAGTPIHVLKELGGWKSFEMLEKYAHLSAEHLAGFAQNAMAKIIPR